MLEDVGNGELIAPRISDKFVLEAKDAKYNKIAGNMKPVENTVLASPILQHETGYDFNVLPVKSSCDQNGCHTPDLQKEELHQNNASLVVTLEEKLPIAEIVGDDLSDSSKYVDCYKRKTERDQSSLTVLEKQATVNKENELNVEEVAPSVKPELLVLETNENNCQEGKIHTSDKENLITTSAEDIVDESLTGNGQEKTENNVSERDELVITTPVEKETQNEKSPSQDSANQEVEKELPEIAASAKYTRKEKISTSSTSNEKIEEAEAISEDDGDSSSSEEDDDASEEGRTESESETETSSSEDSKLGQEMSGRQYITHYEQQKIKEFYTLYPPGKVVLPRGFLLHFCASTRREIVSLKREDINNALVALGAEIAFIDYQKGDLFGWVRFKESCEAHKILSQMPNNTLLIKTVYMVFKKVPKKEETKYLTEAGKRMCKLRQNKVSLDKKLKKLMIEKKKLIKQQKRDLKKSKQENQS
ncbi:uncharacterized protein LOC113506908 [Trichoplusia ni]|uniref:Uncharacterized protein LOC113506908 n=1 Tax=Trichoplusia ni TaxID=7111 RepID=A0A7E5WXH7_TRINI|nr:uncharacterized protein LOC113506908 [Trichoplusia ni]